VVFATFAPSGGVSAQMYYARDGGGTVHFSNVPREGTARFDPGVPVASRLQEELRTSEQASAEDTEFQSLIGEAAARHGVEPALVRAIIRAESSFNRVAVSPKGARGLMQLMPATARRRGCHNPYDARANIEAGVEHLRMLLDQYKKNLPRALAAYNAGTQSVGRYHGIPPYAETEQYVARVLLYRREYLRRERLANAKPPTAKVAALP
jgi:soluble lytic murein transglycosylase-like protein